MKTKKTKPRKPSLKEIIILSMIVVAGFFLYNTLTIASCEGVWSSWGVGQSCETYCASVGKICVVTCHTSASGGSREVGSPCYSNHPNDPCTHFVSHSTQYCCVCSDVASTTTVPSVTTTVPSATSTTIYSTTSTTFITSTTVSHNTCSDSDNGLNYNVKGTVSGLVGSISYSYSDYCSGSAVKEWYCDSEHRPMVSTYTSCPYGCLNGACKSTPATTTTTPTTTTTTIPAPPPLDLNTIIQSFMNWIQSIIDFFI